MTSVTEVTILTSTNLASDVVGHSIKLHSFSKAFLIEQLLPADSLVAIVCASFIGYKLQMCRAYAMLSTCGSDVASQALPYNPFPCIPLCPSFALQLPQSPSRTQTNFSLYPPCLTLTALTLRSRRRHRRRPTSNS